MLPRLGCDIVHISRFADSVRREGEPFLARLFTPEESAGASLERLAGIFAAKEAACKALGIPAGNWHGIRLSHEDRGAPHLYIDPSLMKGAPAETSVSITHDGDYAMAVVFASSL